MRSTENTNWFISKEGVTAEFKRAGTIDPRKILSRVFGFHDFRPGQEEIIRAIVGGRDVFAVLPTGGGKSLCYQLPAHMLPGTCLVISPLISLMKDQVDAAVQIGLRAAFINSSQADHERSAVRQQLIAGDLDLLYVSPERLAMEQFITQLRSTRLCLVAIDEAHCISEWGHDFRPDYLQLSELASLLPDVPVAAFTATATRQVQDDIVVRLRLRDPFILRASFDRGNLYYQITPKHRVEAQIEEFIRDRPDEAGIVYRTTRRAVEQTAEHLRVSGIRALPYHAGMSTGERVRNQDMFSRDEVEVIVATIAFGMGIDKSNVRFVIHADLPRSIENYYQETGRAGRDGAPAHCLLLFSRGDIPRIRYFIDQIENPDEQARSRRVLSRMVAFAGSAGCRRKALLHYFGEEYPGDSCGACDSCSGEVTRYDATNDAHKIVSAVECTGERFGVIHIVNIVSGANTKKIRSFGYDRLIMWGAGKDKPKFYWRGIVDELLNQGIVWQTEGTRPILRLGDSAGAVIAGTRRVFASQHLTTIARTPEHAELRQFDYNQELFETLRALRRSIARSQGVPPYIVFSDRTLHEMATYFPRTEHELTRINGVGAMKLEKYGEQFLASINGFLKEHPGIRQIESTSQSTLPPSRRRARQAQQAPGLGETYEFTWALLEKGKTYEEIAAIRELSPATICSHIERLAGEGRTIDFDRIIDPIKCERIAEVFVDLKTMNLRPVVDKLDGTVSFVEVRLARAWLKQQQQQAG